jgi:hypothetical protein
MIDQSNSQVLAESKILASAAAVGEVDWAKIVVSKNSNDVSILKIWWHR